MHLVLGVCMKYLQNEEESKDALMQLFEKLLTDLKKHEIENFKGWLHSVAKNHCLMKIRSDKSLRKKNEELKKELKAFVEINHSTHLDTDKVNTEKKLLKLEDAIKNLKEEQRICIQLFYLEEKSYVEVSEKTGYSIKNVKSYIQNGKRNIKIQMTAEA